MLFVPVLETKKTLFHNWTLYQRIRLIKWMQIAITGCNLKVSCEQEKWLWLNLFLQLSFSYLQSYWQPLWACHIAGNYGREVEIQHNYIPKVSRQRQASIFVFSLSLSAPKHTGYQCSNIQEDWGLSDLFILLSCATLWIQFKEVLQNKWAALMRGT